MQAFPKAANMVNRITKSKCKNEKNVYIIAILIYQYLIVDNDIAV